MFVRMYVRMSLFLHVCVHVCMHACIYAGVNECNVCKSTNGMYVMCVYHANIACKFIISL
jgi:hypothetical protein